MILHIITVTSDRQNRDFSCNFDDLEKGYDFLLGVKTSGDVFLKAEFVNASIYYSLGIEALNQADTVNPFQQLRQQWEQCLAPEVITQPTHQACLTALDQQLKKSQQRYLANVEQTLQQTLILLESTHIRLSEGHRKTRMIQQCWMTIDRCNRSIAQLTASPRRLRSTQAAR